jgi:hypothetical protein
MKSRPTNGVTGRSWASTRSTVASAVIEHGSQAFFATRTAPAVKEGARPKEAPGRKYSRHREACSPWGASAGNHGPVRGWAQAGVGSANAPQAPSTQRAT